MKSSWLLLISIVIVLVVVFGDGAQNSSAQIRPCLRPFSEKYDEITFTNPDELKVRLEKFNSAFRKESSDARALIYVYGGKRTRISEIADRVDNIQKILRIDSKNYQSKIWVSEAGYRTLPTIELFIIPLACSEQPKAIADFRADEVEFLEFPAKNTLKLQRSDVYTRSTERPEAECPAAAKAVRACIEGTEVEVFIIVDSKGSVRVSQSVTGHPFLRKAAEIAAKQWVFRPLVNGDETLNFSGSILLQFNSSYELINAQIF